MDYSSLISLTRISFRQCTYFYQEFIYTLNNTYIYNYLKYTVYKIPGRNFQDVTSQPTLLRASEAKLTGASPKGGKCFDKCDIKA